MYPPIVNRLAHQCRALVVALLVLWACTFATPLSAQTSYITGELVAEAGVEPGETVMVALAFTPQSGWHGYWANPGDAGLGMRLEWALPPGWSAGELRYPVPETLVISGLMNHVFKGPYAVLVPLRVPADAAPGSVPIRVNARYLACSDVLCVPQEAMLAARIVVGGIAGERDSRFAAWRAAIPPRIESDGTFERAGQRIRVAVPLPRGQDVVDPHLFVESTDLVDHAAPQSIRRSDGAVVVELPVSGNLRDLPDRMSGLLRYGADGSAIAFEAGRGTVPSAGLRSIGGGADVSLPLLLALALAGGLVLNLLPCVFPVLSLKALHLAGGGASEAAARRDALAYGAGALTATIGLGALLLALRAGGEQIGWAFQLQQPGIVMALLALMVAVTGNLLGLFDLPSLSLRGKGGGSSFVTGLLAAFIATPCTGPFMASALGAALVLPAWQALALFAALGMGLALPFMAVGFVPNLRRRLPKPGPWMERFRRWMALPMALTALALAWLTWRLGGAMLVASGVLLGLLAIAALRGIGRRREAGRAPFGGLVACALAGALALAVFGPYYARAPQAGAAGGVIEAQPYSRAALAEARAAGRPIFLWFTADWCITCKANEAVAIEREATREAFEQAGVIVLRADWTRPDPEIARFLESRGAAGVPLYIWIAPDGREERLPQILSSPSLLVQRALARRAAAPEAVERAAVAAADGPETGGNAR